MIQYISEWIGEEKLVGPEYDGPEPDLFKVQLRAVKRSCVVSMMEQMVNCFANDNECNHYDASAECECFTVVNRRVPNRISKAHLMAYRLYFGSSNNFANKKKSMRMTQTRNLWTNTSDLVIKRNAALLKLKTEDWGSTADAALIHLGNLLNFDVVQVETEAQTDLFDDSDDESAVAVHFSGLGVGQERNNQTQQPTSTTYNVNDGSIQNEITKFLNLPASHFVECKSLIYFKFCAFFSAWKFCAFHFAFSFERIQCCCTTKKRFRSTRQIYPDWRSVN